MSKKPFIAEIKFYGSLNGFISKFKSHRMQRVPFGGNPSVKDFIEARGVPHVEVDVILVNGRSVDFKYNLEDGDRIQVYPQCFNSEPEVENVRHLQPGYPDLITFILDVHLGALARLLRLAGFDTDYSNDRDDAEIVRQATKEHRVVLTRDVDLLKFKNLKFGYWVRNTNPEKQAIEIVKRFKLKDQIRPFTRCMNCNGRLQPVEKDKVWEKIPPKVKKWRDSFTQCRQCGKIYWKGTHYNRLLKKLDRIKNSCNEP